jgi:hypothetical protein
MDRSQWAQRIQADLGQASRARKASLALDALLRARMRQARRERLRQTHAQLWSDPSQAQAAQFFLDDIYPQRAQAWRDGQALAALASMARLLPMPALEALGHAVKLDALSERVDGEVQERLAKIPSVLLLDAIDFEKAMERASAQCGQEALEEQLGALGDVAQALLGASRLPLARQALAAMAWPAKLAGLSDLQGFLERGLSVFARLADPEAFCAGLIERERSHVRGLESMLRAPILPGIHDIHDISDLSDMPDRPDRPFKQD